MTPQILIAELPPIAGSSGPESALAIGSLVVTGAALVAGYNQFTKLIDRNKPSPPLHQEYATKAELRAHEERMTHQLTELTAAVAASNQRSEVMVVRIHDRLEKLSDKLFDIAKDHS